MAELVGATFDTLFWQESPRLLKQHLLMFDRLATTTRPTSLVEVSEEARAYKADLVYLAERGVLFAFRGRGVRGVLGADEDRLTPDEQPVKDALENFGLKTQSADVRRAPFSDLLSRTMAVNLRLQRGVNAVPLTRVWSGDQPSPKTRSDVIQLVIKDLPIPGDRHSLENVMDFREESRTRGLPQSLRVWINEVASGKLTGVEISDKLEDLVSQYERALKLEKMERNTSFVETVVTTTADIAEGLVKFQWSSLAKKLFECRHKEVALMKAEESLPGREIAYIVKARERFGNGFEDA